MSIVGNHNVGVNIPEIPSRAQRRKRAKQAGVFKHKGGWQHVNAVANMQRDEAIKKAVDLQHKRANAPKQSDKE